MAKWHGIEKRVPPVGERVICYDEFYGRIAIGYNTGRLDDSGKGETATT